MSGGNLSTPRVSEIWIHPVKSLAGISLPECRVDAYGFEHDRKYMLCIHDSKSSGYKFLTQRQVPALTLVRTSIDTTNNLITLSFNQHTVQIPLEIEEYVLAKLPTLSPEIWGLRPESVDITELCRGLPEFFDAVRGTSARDTIIVAAGQRRKVTASMPRELADPHQSSFQDYYPGNLICQRSLDELAQRVATRTSGQVAICSRNFRPNLVISGTSHAWDEDDWKQVVIGQHAWYIPCRNIRCRIPNVNLKTGVLEATHEPYKTLQSFRRIDKGMPYYPCFGMNMAPKQSGFMVRVGDELQITQRGDHCYEDISIVR